MWRPTAWRPFATACATGCTPRARTPSLRWTGCVQSFACPPAHATDDAALAEHAGADAVSRARRGVHAPRGLGCRRRRNVHASGICAQSGQQRRMVLRWAGAEAATAQPRRCSLRRICPLAGGAALSLGRVRWRRVLVRAVAAEAHDAAVPLSRSQQHQRARERAQSASRILSVGRPCLDARSALRFPFHRLRSCERQAKEARDTGLCARVMMRLARGACVGVKTEAEMLLSRPSRGCVSRRARVRAAQALVRLAGLCSLAVAGSRCAGHPCAQRCRSRLRSPRGAA